MMFVLTEDDVKELESATRELVKSILKALKANHYQTARKEMSIIQKEIEKGNIPDTEAFRPVFEGTARDFLTPNLYSTHTREYDIAAAEKIRTFFTIIGGSTESTANEFKGMYSKIIENMDELQRRTDLFRKKYMNFYKDSFSISGQTSLTLLGDLIKGLYEGPLSYLEKIGAQIIIDERNDLKEDAHKVAKNLISVKSAFPVKVRGKERYTPDIKFVRNAFSHDTVDIQDEYIVFEGDKENPDLKISLTYRDIIDWILVSLKKLNYFDIVIRIYLLILSCCMISGYHNAEGES